MKLHRPAMVSRLAAGLTELRRGHEARHSPSGCDFAIASHITDLDAGSWDAACAGGSVFLQRPYLAALDRESPEGVDHRFILASHRRQPVAAIVCQLLAMHGERLGADRLRGAGRAAAKRLHVRVLVAGNLLTWGMHAMAVAPGADPALAWAALGEALYRVRRSEELGGAPDLQLIKDLPGAERPQHLRRLGYRAAATDPDMVLELDPAWKDWGGYLAALAAKYRKQAKDCLAAVDAAGIVCEECRDPAVVAADLHRLYLAVQARAAVRPVTIGPGYLPAVAAALGDGFRCCILRRGDAIVGFITAIRDGDTAIGYHVGFDPAVNDACPIYFRLLYRSVEQAMALGCRRLSLGRTALEPKARLGARPQPLAVWARHRRQGLNLLLRPLLGLVPHHEAPERNPFKGKAGG